MRTISWRTVAVVIWAFHATTGLAATYFVSATSGSDAHDGLAWTSPKRTIQAAIDVAISNDVVLVSNGVYNVGGEVIPGGRVTNRVFLAKPIELRSVNGPYETMILGAGPAGSMAVRCAYVSTGAQLTGFTLAGGHTRIDPHEGDSQGGGCYAPGGTISNCVIRDCRSGNGGGVHGGVIYNSILQDNFAASAGGGSRNSTQYNCALVRNLAAFGGGAYGGALVNCTVVGNVAATAGGGCYVVNATNCIIYFNTSPSGSNHYSMTAGYSCTAPDPGGTGNITADPLLLSGYRVMPTSPCLGAGNSNFTTGVDIDGENWGAPPSMGCDEVYGASLSGSLAVSVHASGLAFPTGFIAQFQVDMVGKPASNLWTFGDGIVITNTFLVQHTWSSTGTFDVAVTAFNADNPLGVAATLTVSVLTQLIHYVDLASATPAAPYLSWATAATSMQDAVDAAVSSGAVVLVAAGIYNQGVARTVGTYSMSRLNVSRPVLVQSVAGPEATIIAGSGTTSAYGGVRCAYLANNATLSGFTLTNGYSGTSGGDSTQSGGGSYAPSGTLTNCIIVGCHASGNGGAVFGGLVLNSLLRGNTAGSYGGGACSATLTTCRVEANTAGLGGGGTAYSLLRESVLANNASEIWGGGSFEDELWDCTVSSNIAQYLGGGISGGSEATACALNYNSSSGAGGGAWDTDLVNCLLFNNFALTNGGGAAGGGLFNCTVISNQAGQVGGGVDGATVYNSIVQLNDAPLNPNFSSGYIEHSCASPLPPGLDNFTNDPGFVDMASGNYRLTSNSPCIDAGLTVEGLLTISDLDGLPRVRNAGVDVGAYEHQGRAVSWPWLQSYGLPADGTAIFGDTDADGYETWEEYLAGTDPTNGTSWLGVLSPTEALDTGTGVVVRWQSGAGRYYDLERATNLMAMSPFTVVKTNIPGQAIETTVTDITATANGPYIYRISTKFY